MKLVSVETTLYTKRWLCHRLDDEMEVTLDEYVTDVKRCIDFVRPNTVLSEIAQEQGIDCASWVQWILDGNEFAYTADLHEFAIDAGIIDLEDLALLSDMDIRILVGYAFWYATRDLVSLW